MKVKIGTTIYDSNVEPIMLIFDDDAQRLTAANNLKNMVEMDAVRKYAVVPTSMKREDIDVFMKLDNNG